MRILCVHIPGFPVDTWLDSQGRAYKGAPGGSREGYGSITPHEPGSPGEAVNALWDDIVSSLKSFTMRVETITPGTVCLDVTKPLQIYLNEELLALSIIQMILMSFQLEATIGIGNSRFVAHIAASRCNPLHVVPPGAETAFLSSLPVDILPVEEEIKGRLKLLGLYTLGKVARLSRETLMSQFGHRGKEIWKYVNGMEDTNRILPVRAITRLDNEIICDAPIEAVAHLLVPLDKAMHEIASELAHLGKACRKLHLHLYLQDKGRLKRLFTFHVPTASKEEMAQRLVDGLSSVTLESPVTGFLLSALALSPAEVAQESLFRAKPCSTEKLTNVRGYLKARYGQVPLVKVEEQDIHTLLPEKRYRFVEI